MMDAGTVLSAREEIAWPPQSERDRLQRYEANRLLYRTHPQLPELVKYFAPVSAERRFYLQLNLCAAVTDLLSGRLFAEGVVAKPPDASGSQEFLDFLYDDNQLGRLLLQGAQTASYSGDAVLKVRYDGDEQRVIVDWVHPSHFIPLTDPLNNKRMVGAQLWEVLVVKQGTEKRSYLLIEQHEMRGGEAWITNRLWRLTDGKRFNPLRDELALTDLPITAGLKPEQPTGIDELLVVHVPNIDDPSAFFGIDDYARLLPVQNELNNRRTQVAHVLDKHADPLIAVRADLVGEDGKLQVSGGRAIPLPDVGAGSVPAMYLTWDGRLDQAEAEIREIVRFGCSLAGIDQAAIIPPEVGGPLSGRAIRLSQWQTQGTVGRRRLTWEPGVKRVLSIATKLGALYPLADVKQRPKPLYPRDITLQFGDGLPADEFEDAQQAVLLHGAELQSTETTLRVLHPTWTDEEVMAEVDRIKAERATVGPQDVLGLEMGAPNTRERVGA